MLNRVVNYVAAIATTFIIASLLGMKSQEKYTDHQVQSMQLLIDQYDAALRIAGNQYENYVLDVYSECDEYETSSLKDEYESYLNHIDSIKLLKYEY